MVLTWPEKMLAQGIQIYSISERVKEMVYCAMFDFLKEGKE